MNAVSRMEVELPGCRLICEVEPGSWPLDDLCDFAVRQNARRRFLFVSKVLGRHWPTPPTTLRAVAAALARKLMDDAFPPPVLFIGMAETATTLAQAVFRCWYQVARPAVGTALYVDTTRRRTGGAVAFTFFEDHSHATEHFVHEPTSADDPHDVFHRARTLMIVDDEATTGRTVSNLVRAYAGLRGMAVEKLRVQVAVLTRWREEGAPAIDKVPLHALLHGTFSFTVSGGFPDAMPQQVCPDRGACAPRGTRHGIARPEALPATVTAQARSAAAKGARHLVLGAGEFGFAPLLWAEAIEAMGAEAALQAVTRSPILAGGAIRHVRSFPALCGGGHTEFLYNVPDDHLWDVVWLCCEGSAPLPASHSLWQVPRLREAPLLRSAEN